MEREIGKEGKKPNRITCTHLIPEWRPCVKELIRNSLQPLISQAFQPAPAWLPSELLSGMPLFLPGAGEARCAPVCGGMCAAATLWCYAAPSLARFLHPYMVSRRSSIICNECRYIYRQNIINYICKWRLGKLFKTFLGAAQKPHLTLWVAMSLLYITTHVIAEPRNHEVNTVLRRKPQPHSTAVCSASPHAVLHNLGRGPSTLISPWPHNCSSSRIKFTLGGAVHHPADG